MTASPELPSVSPIEWAVSRAPVGYEAALQEMEARAAAIAEGRAVELVWLIEHPPIYTAGTSARSEHLLSTGGLPVFQTGRGGQLTYHGPGQRIAYVMLDVRRRANGDVRQFVAGLERWIMDALWRLGLDTHVRQGRVGIWVARPDKGEDREDKIAAIGIRVKRWVSFHGVSLNVDCDLAPFEGIVPCGIADQGVTSLRELGLSTRMAELDLALRLAFVPLFGATIDAAAPVPRWV